MARTLHVMHDARTPPSSSPPPATSWAAVHHYGAGGHPWPSLRPIRVAGLFEIEPPVKTRRPHRHLPLQHRRRGDDRRNQRPFALVQQCDWHCFVIGEVGHDGGHRGQGFGVVHMGGGIGIGRSGTDRRKQMGPFVHRASNAKKGGGGPIRGRQRTRFRL